MFHHLSNVDTDRMQTQFLSNAEVAPVKPSQQSILPTIPYASQPSRQKATVTELTKIKSEVTSHSSNVYHTQPKGPGDNKVNYASPHSIILQGKVAPERQASMKEARTKASRKLGKEQNSRRVASTRPIMHIKEGKLLLSGPIVQPPTFF